MFVDALDAVVRIFDDFVRACDPEDVAGAVCVCGQLAACVGCDEDVPFVGDGVDAADGPLGCCAEFAHLVFLRCAVHA